METIKQTTIYPLLDSEKEFLRFVIVEYQPRNRLEEKDKQNVLIALKQLEEGNAIGLPEKQRNTIKENTS